MTMRKNRVSDALLHPKPHPGLATLSLAGTVQLAFQPKNRESHWREGGAAFMPLQRESLFGVRWRPDVLDSEAA
jgi:hypothetical protein